MKIDPLSLRGTDALNRPGVQEAQGQERMLTFTRQLTQMHEKEYQAHIGTLIEDITKQGKKMSDKADMREVVIYKNMIRELINETVSNGYAFEKSSRFDMRRRNKTFALIKEVSGTLNKMTEDLLRSEAGNVQLLGYVDDIRGMLVDMLL